MVYNSLVLVAVLMVNRHSATFGHDRRRFIYELYNKVIMLYDFVLFTRYQNGCQDVVLFL